MYRSKLRTLAIPIDSKIEVKNEIQRKLVRMNVFITNTKEKSKPLLKKSYKHFMRTIIISPLRRGNA